MIKRAVFLLLIGSLACGLLRAQGTADTLDILNESEIIIRIEQITQEIQEVANDLSREAPLRETERGFRQLQPELERYLEIGGDQLETAGINKIQDLVIIFQRRDDQLVRWQNDILDISRSLSNDRIKINRSIYELDSLRESNPLLFSGSDNQLNFIYGELNRLDELLKKRKQRLLQLELDISRLHVRVMSALQELRNYRNQFWSKLFLVDEEIALVNPEDRLSVGTRISTTFWRVTEFIQKNWTTTLLMAVIFITIVYALQRIKRRDQEGKYRVLYQRQIPVALVLTLLLFPALYPPTTTLLYNFMLIGAYIPFLLVLRCEPFRKHIYWFFTFFMAFFAFKLAVLFNPHLSDNVVKLIAAIAGIVFFVFLVKGNRYMAFDPKWRITKIFAWILKALLIVAFIGLLTRRSLLFLIIVNGAGDTIALGLFLLYVSFWLNHLISYLNELPVFNNASQTDGHALEQWKVFTRAVVLVLFLVGFFHYFHVKDSFGETLSTLLYTPRTVGSTTLTLSGVLLFFLVIYLSAKIASWIKFFSEGKSFYRDAKRTSTFATMLRFGIILIGFLLALFLSGIPLDKITIILGALSVGLGFGLQNIVNNLVSGIILIFERPVQAGDFVEIKNYTGIVKEIGIRASILKTFDGAEIIIPNGHLISDEVINWTLSNQHRRVEVMVGVAYGSDVDKVKNLLTEVVSAYKGILKLPKPLVLFNDFGDSSLNFSVRFWVSNIDDFLNVKSDITTEVYKTFDKEGITIPFPQRDLHIRTMTAAQVQEAEITTHNKKKRES